MITQRQFKIVFLLWKHKGTLTSMEISNCLHVSDRTIKNEIALMQIYAKKYGFFIESKRGLGYQLTMHNKVIFQNEIVPHLACYTEVSEIPDDDKIRIYKVLCLLFQQDCITADQIAATLFIDKRSLHRTFYKIRKLLQQYRLTLTSKANYGFKVEGNELYQRFCIMDTYAYYHHIPALIRKDILYQTYFKVAETKRHKMRTIWLEVMRQQSYTIKDIHLEKFFYQVLLSTHRFKMNKVVELEETIKERILTWDSYQIITLLNNELKQAGLLDIDESERLYLSIVLFCYLDVHNEEQMKSNPYFYKQSSQCIQYLMQSMQPMLPIATLSHKAIQDLQFVIFPIIVRMHCHMYENNKWLRNWRLKNILISPVALELGYLGMQKISAYYNNFTGNDDIFQLAYAFQTLFYQQHIEIKKVNIVIIPSSGYVSALPIVNQLNQYFKEYISSIEIKERYTIRGKKDIKRYDVLISSLEYGNDFKGQITWLNIDAILECRYQEVCYKVIGIEDKYKKFLSNIKKIDFIEIESLTCIEDIFKKLYINDYFMKQQYQAFKMREEMVFNCTYQSKACYFRFVDKKQEERFTIVKLVNPLVWQSTAIDTIIICFIYPENVSQYRFYDIFLNHLLRNEESMLYLWNTRNIYALHNIIRKCISLL